MCEIVLINFLNYYVHADNSVCGQLYHWKMKIMPSFAILAIHTPSMGSQLQ